MKKALARIVGSLIALAAMGGYIGIVPLRDVFAQQVVPITAESGFRHAIMKRRMSSEFNLRVRATPRTAHPSASILLNYQDEDNYYRIQIAGDGTRIIKTENGLQTEIGDHSGVGLPTDVESDIVVKRRRSWIRVILNGKAVAKAYDDTFSRGQIGLGALDNSVSFGRAKSQSIGEIYFSDDFMRGLEDTETWGTAGGSWHISSLTNASLSSNAFFYYGSAWKQTAVSLNGHWFWDDYTFRVSCQPKTDKPFGLYFYYRDKDNYYLLKFSTADDHKAQLIKALHGKESVLAQRPLDYAKDQWYLLEVQIYGEKVTAYVDGNLILEVTDRNLCYGGIGLYTEGRTYFDDVEVMSHEVFEDDFAAPIAGKWQELGGVWDWSGESCRASAKGSAKVISGDIRWRDYTFSADIDLASPAPGSEASGETGICFYYQDERNYYLFTISDDKCQLAKVVDGKNEALAERTVSKIEKPTKTKVAARRNVAVQVDEGYIAAYIDGAKAAEACNADLSNGKIGLYLKGASSAGFDNVKLTFNPKKKAVLTRHEVFAHEESMANWAASQSDWQVRSDQINGRRTNVYWHRAEIPGDTDIRVKIERGFGEGDEVGLIVNAGGKGGSRNAVTPSADGGYLFAFSKKHGTFAASVRRLEKEVAQRSLENIETPRMLRLRRCGSFVIGYVNEKPVINFKDDNPLQGTRAAWSATSTSGAVAGPTIDKENVEIFSDSVFVYSFNESPHEWRQASGDWTVTNRWECDPRWSFFSGSSYQLAAIYNKRDFEGDISLEFAAGIKMDRARGNRYQYASDLNATICANGADLTSGYSFVFGGWGNQYTRILRNNEIVAETRYRVIPIQENIHRRWFYIKVDKKGPELRFWIDNDLVLKYHDDDPLSGKKAAIWTWNNGIMVARVRVSSESGKSKELPYPSGSEDARAQVRCCYNATVRPSKRKGQGNERPASTTSPEIARRSKELSDPEDSVRWAAVLALEKIGAPAVPALIKELGSENQETRWKAGSALVKIGKDAVPALHSALENENIFIRRQAAYLLGELADQKSIQPLAKALGDEDEDVGWKAAASLVKFGASAVDAVTQELQSDSPAARKRSAWIFQEIKDTSTIRPLIHALSDEDSEVSMKSAIALQKIGSPAVPDLIKTFKETKNHETRKLIVSVLTELSGADTMAQLAVTDFQKATEQKEQKEKSLAPKAEGQESIPPVKPVYENTLSISSNPDGATAFLDDKYVGVTPVTVENVAPRSHSLKLVKSDFAPLARVINIAEKRSEVQIELKPKAKTTISLTSLPNRADVYLDNKFVGRTPITIKDLDPDVYQVMLQKENCVTWKGEADTSQQMKIEIKKKLRSRSETYYLASIVKDPNNCSYHVELAHIYVLHHDFDKAMASLATAVKITLRGMDTSDYKARLYQEMEKIYMGMFDYGGEQAISIARQKLEAALEGVIREMPTGTELATFLGGLYQKSGKYSEAVAVLERTLKYAQNDYNVHFKLGQSYSELGIRGDSTARKKAISHLKKALQYCYDGRVRNQIQAYLRKAQYAR